MVVEPIREVNKTSSPSSPHFMNWPLVPMTLLGQDKELIAIRASDSPQNSTEECGDTQVTAQASP